MTHRVALIGLTAIFTLTGCHKTHVAHDPAPPPYEHAVSGGPPPHAKAHGYRAKHKYYYYPGSHVYYAPDRGTYFWLEGDNWSFGVALPRHIVVDTTDRVSVELDTSKPYLEHSYVSQRYPGKSVVKGKNKWRYK